MQRPNQLLSTTFSLNLVFNDGSQLLSFFLAVGDVSIKLFKRLLVTFDFLTLVIRLVLSLLETILCSL